MDWKRGIDRKCGTRVNKLRRYRGKKVRMKSMRRRHRDGKRQRQTQRCQEAACFPLFHAITHPCSHSLSPGSVSSPHLLPSLLFSVIYKVESTRFKTHLGMELPGGVTCVSTILFPLVKKFKSVVTKTNTHKGKMSCWIISILAQIFLTCCQHYCQMYQVFRSQHLSFSSHRWWATVNPRDVNHLVFRGPFRGLKLGFPVSCHLDFWES